MAGQQMAKRRRIGAVCETGLQGCAKVQHYRPRKAAGGMRTKIVSGDVPLIFLSAHSLRIAGWASGLGLRNTIGFPRHVEPGLHRKHVPVRHAGQAEMIHAC